MSASRTALCNLALAHAGLEGGVLDVDTEQSVEAARCRQWYDQVRRMTLNAYDWSFARKRTALTKHDEAADDDDTYYYSIRYALPLDMLSLRELRPFGLDGRSLPHRFEIASDGTRSLLTSVPDARIRYTFDLTNTELFSPMFDLAFSLTLGAYITEPATGKTSKRYGLLQEANAALRTAVEDDHQGEQEEPAPDAPWIQARSTYHTLYDSHGPANVFTEVRNLRAATGSGLRR